MKLGKFQAETLLVLVALIWGSTFLIVQTNIKTTGPIAFLTFRFGIAALVLAIIYWRHLRRITKAELFSGTIIGFFLFVGYVCQTVGLQYTTSSKAGFITGLYVVIVPILSIWVLKQWPTIGATIGVILATLGLTLLSVNDKFDPQIGLGEILLLGCAISFAGQIIAITKYAPGNNVYNLTIVQIGVTALFSSLSLPFFGESLQVYSFDTWLAILAMAVIATAFALAVMNRVQPLLGSTRAALIYALEPVFAGVFGYWAGEQLSPAAIIGCLLIFIGMIAGELKFKKTDQESLTTIYGGK